MLFFLYSGHKRYIYYIYSNGVEIDRKQYQAFIEIKKSSTSTIKMFNAIKQGVTEKDKGFLIYNGESFKYSGQIQAINYKTYLE